MKKNPTLLTIAVIGIITAISITQFSYSSPDELLNANVEALAWQGSEGPDVTILPCTFSPKDKCTYSELAQGPEGELIVVGKRTKDGFKNTGGEAM